MGLQSVDCQAAEEYFWQLNFFLIQRYVYLDNFCQKSVSLFLMIL
jgi:hypothetical protein